MGFEPTVSCVTGRRPLRAGPRGRFDGVLLHANDAASCGRVLSKYRRQDSNLHSPRSKRGASCRWATPAREGSGVRGVRGQEHSNRTLNLEPKPLNPAVAPRGLEPRFAFYGFLFVGQDR
jgi:hypothetical protein